MVESNYKQMSFLVNTSKKIWKYFSNIRISSKLLFYMMEHVTKRLSKKICQLFPFPLKLVVAFVDIEQSNLVFFTNSPKKKFYFICKNL